MLELLQNADDAGKSFPGTSRLLFRLTADSFIAANTGVPFSNDGITSLVISDRSPKQLERGRFIGQKGLGFRSLLSWSERPFVRSGQHAVAFSPEHAKRVATSVAKDVAALREEMERYATQYGAPPVPIMRFPYEPSHEDPRVHAADSVRREGYDTIIVLPLPEGGRREAVRSDIVHQVGEMSASTLLFSNYLTEIRLEVEDRVATWSVERQAGPTGDTVMLQHDGDRSLWTLHRREVEIPQHLLEDDSEAMSVGLALAVPEEIENGVEHSLCVFFPTSVSLPMPMLAHATLETDDSRKRLIVGAETEFALRELAGFTAAVAEVEAKRSSNAWRGLELLAGVERSDPDLTRLGFLEELFDQLRLRRIFPRLDGSLGNASEFWIPPSVSWRRVAGSDWLGDLLDDPSSHGVDGLLARLALRTLPLEEQARRLEAKVAAELMDGEHERAGALLGALLEARALPKSPLASVLVDDAGVQLKAATPLLLPPEGPAPHRPDWATDIYFLHPRFAEGMRSFGQLSARELSRKLSESGYTVEEYQLETVARRLIRSAEQLDAVSPDGAVQRHRDVLRCVFEMARTQESTALINAPFQVVTDQGLLRPASRCYVGDDYPSGRLLTALYRPLGQDEFCAGPQQLGLEGGAAEVEAFLGRIGVALQVRQHQLNSGWLVQQAGLRDHIRETFSRLTYPRDLSEYVFQNANDAFQLLDIDYGEFQVPDRWAEVLKKGDAGAIIAYLVTTGLPHLNGGPATGLVLRARYGQQSNHRRLWSVPVSDPVLFLLREVAWVPCDDGARHQPRRVALSRVARRALGQAFRSHSIDSQSPFVSPVGGTTAIQMVLQAAGAVQSLDSLRGDDLYALLTELPERDPEGDVAASVYRSLLEAGQLDIDSPRREEFIRHGRMWGTQGVTARYFAVGELRYAPRTAIPEPVRQYVPLVAVDPRRNVTEVERVFGIRALASDEYQITVDEEATQRVEWSDKASRHLRACAAHLYALRLSQRADDRGEERHTFSDLELVVARQISARVTLGDRDPETVIIRDDLKGLATGARIYIVVRDLNFSLDPVFLRAVADLVADVINVPRAGGDFASLLACADDRQRTRLLDHMTSGLGTARLSDARAALEFTDSEEEVIVDLSPPRVAVETQTATVAPLEEQVLEPLLVSGHSIPVPISAPVPRPAAVQRDLVVTGSSPNTGFGHQPATPEEVSLQIAERFESFATPRRFPIRVAHLRGASSFGCDIISLGTREARDRALADQSVGVGDVIRFIEVKGRSSRSGAVELTENERAAAAQFGARYFIYRVYTDPAQSDYHELAVLSDPTSSPSEVLRASWFYNLAEASGATWYLMPLDDASEPTEVRAPDPTVTNIHAELSESAFDDHGNG